VTTLSARLRAGAALLLLLLLGTLLFLLFLGRTRARRTEDLGHRTASVGLPEF